jgi:hypothetical protein
MVRLISPQQDDKKNRKHGQPVSIKGFKHSYRKQIQLILHSIEHNMSAKQSGYSKPHQIHRPALSEPLTAQQLRGSKSISQHVKQYIHTLDNTHFRWWVSSL